MTITDKTYPYEVLVRFNPDGTPRGAHCQRIRVVTLNGETLKEDILDPEEIDTTDFPTSVLMADATRDALAIAQRLQDDNANVLVLLDGLQKENAHLKQLLAGPS